jgi:hypothetical protein
LKRAVDPRLLLVRYNRAVREQHLDLPLWPDRLLKAVAAEAR